MQLNYNEEKNQLKIDNGDHYYFATVTKNDFPSIISDDYIDIIKKSFDNFSDENTSVKHNLTEDSYVINFDYNCKPIKISEIIKIKIVRHEKDFKDYTNERIEKLELKIVELSAGISKIATMLENKIITTESEDKNEIEVESEEEEEEDSEKETKLVSSKIKIKDPEINIKKNYSRNKKLYA
jgi:hypothetical protein